MNAIYCMHLKDDKKSPEIQKQRKKKNGKKWREVNKRGVYGRDMLKLTQRIFMPTNTYFKLDPVGSSVRYEMMKLCTGSV